MSCPKQRTIMLSFLFTAFLIMTRPFPSRADIYDYTYTGNSFNNLGGYETTSTAPLNSGAR